MPVSYHAIFIVFWIAQIVYGLACVFGPFIASNLTLWQKRVQTALIATVVLGVLFTPAFYVVSLIDQSWPNVKYVVLYPFPFIPGVNESLSSYWLCLISPALLLLAILLTALMFVLNPKKSRSEERR